MKNIFKRKKVNTTNEVDIYKQKLENRKEIETKMGDVTNPIYLKYLTNACNMIDEVIEKLSYLDEEGKKEEIYNLEKEYSKNLELFTNELYNNIKIEDSLKSKLELQRFNLLPYIRTFKVTYMCDLYKYIIENNKTIQTNVD